MTGSNIRNVAASVRARLRNIAREKGEDFDLTLGYYAIERLLYRLSVSSFAERFVLKGAMLFTVWHMEGHRPTRDLDLLGFGRITPEELIPCFRKICVEKVVSDGVVFDPASVQADYIREQSEYGGVRVKLRGEVSSARVSVQIDVGTGDAITPEPLKTYYPVILEEFPEPQLKVYPVYTVVAEKLEAMVQLGMANSRMKDIYDLMVFARDIELENPILHQAIAATFARRGTDCPETEPTAFMAEFFEDPVKQTQWNAFLRKNRLEENRPPTLEEAISCISQRFGSLMKKNGREPADLE